MDFFSKFFSKKYFRKNFEKNPFFQKKINKKKSNPRYFCGSRFQWFTISSMASSVCLKGDIWYVSNVTLEARGNLGRCRQGWRCTLTSENTTTSYANSRGNSFLNEFKIERTLHDIWRRKIESHENISVEYGGVLRQKETSNYLWLLLFSWVLQKETSKTEPVPVFVTR